MSQLSYLNEEKTKGKYIYPNGNIYIGDFKNEKFHGEGILIFKDKGKYKGKWENGKIVDGQYYFSDGLHYKSNWEYLIDDPYFYNEQMNRNEVIYTKEKENVYLDKIYDTGDGYCKIDEKIVYDFNDNKEIRKVNEREQNWIKNHCAKYLD